MKTDDDYIADLLTAADVLHTIRSIEHRQIAGLAFEAYFAARNPRYDQSRFRAAYGYDGKRPVS